MMINFDTRHDTHQGYTKPKSIPNQHWLRVKDPSFFHIISIPFGKGKGTHRVNQHPSAHHPLDDSGVDEPQLELIFGFTLVTNSVKK
jgi:hypothetical protein